MNKLINKLNQNSRKILREDERKNNSSYTEKVYNYFYENEGMSGENNLNFYSTNNSIIELCVSIYVSTETNFQLFFNDVLIINVSFSGHYLFNKKMYSNIANNIKFAFNSKNSTNIRIDMNLKGEIKNNKNMLFNVKNIDNEIYFVNNHLLSETNDLLTIYNALYDANQYKSDKYFDVNVNYNNLKNNENFISYIYVNVDGDMILKNNLAEYDIELSNVQDACLLASDDEDNYYNIVYIIDGKIYFKSYNLSMDLVSSCQLSGLNYINFCSVKSISGDVPINYFWAQSKNNVWYLIQLNLSGQVLSVREYVNCIDLFNYYIGGLSYLLQLNNEGIKFEKFLSIDLSGKSETVFYKNANNAFIYNSTLYLVNGFAVQEIAL